MFRLKGKWKKGILIGLISLVSLLGLASLSVWIYQDDLVKAGLDKMESYVTSDARVGSVHVSLWKSFPMVSLVFNEVWIEDGLKKKDTLVYGQEVSLSFDLLDLLGGQYEVNKISVQHAQFNLGLNEMGKPNWLVWKSDSLNQEKINVHLQKVNLSDIQVNYVDKASRWQVSQRLVHSTLTGDFSEDLVHLDLESKGFLEQVRFQQERILKPMSLELDGTLNYSKAEKKLVLDETEIQLNDLPIQMHGWWNGTSKQVDFDIQGNKVDVAQTMSLMPYFIQRKFNAYEPDGQASVTGKISGSTERPVVNARLNWWDGVLIEPTTGTEMDHINLNVEYKLKGKLQSVFIHDMNANLSGGQWNVKGEISNFSQPKLDLKATVETDVNSLKEFAQWDTLEEAAGKLKIQSHLTGEVVFNADSTVNWNGLHADGNLAITDGHLKLKGVPHAIDKLFSIVQLHQDDAFIQQLIFNWGKSDFDATGRLINLVPFVFNDNQKLTAEVEWTSNQFWLEDFIFQSQGQVDPALPKNLILTARCKTGHFHHQQFEATNLSTELQLNEHVLNLNHITLMTAGGEVRGLGSLEDNNNGTWSLDVETNFSNLDIRQLFAEFKDFGQSYIQSHHLLGKLDAGINITVLLDQNWQVMKPSLMALVDMKISKGELISFQPLDEVATYIKENKWIAPLVDEALLAQKLKHVRFSTLQNVISIHDEVIEIPWMEINSSALNIMVKGNHFFDGRMDYMLGFYVRDLLLRDPSQSPTEEGKQIFISMQGTTDAPKFGVEKKPDFILIQEQNDSERKKLKEWVRLGLLKKWQRNKKEDDQNTPSSAHPDEPTPKPLSQDRNSTNSNNNSHSNAGAKSKKDNKGRLSSLRNTGNKPTPKWLQEKPDLEDTQP